jgi:hypothetical protein
VDVLTFLVLDIGLDHLVGDVAGGNSTVSSRPEVTSPVLLLEMGKLLVQEVRTLSFEGLHHVADGEMGRVRDEQMDMIWGDFPRDDANLQLGTDPSDQGSDGFTDLARQYSATVLWDPDQMHFQIGSCMAVGFVEFHAVMLQPPTFDLKGRLKAGVFTIPPRRQ